MTLRRNNTNGAYNCADVERLTQKYIDGELDAEEVKRFEEHVEYCLPCDKKVEFESKLKEIVRLKSREAEPTHSLKERISHFLNDLQ